MRAICVGHSTFDTTLSMNEYPIENTKNRVEKHIECGGGPASNGAYLLQKWGMPTVVCSIVGDDYYGDRIIDDFIQVGADIRYIEKMKGHFTDSSYILANMSNGSRTIVTAKDVKVRKLSHDVLDKCDVILIDGEHPETAHQVLDNNPNAVSVLDAGRLNDDTRALGKKVTYVVCSHEFAEEFSNKKFKYDDINLLTEVHKELANYFNTNIIITLEANGSFTIIDGEYKIVPSIKVKALDSTGAGDIFHGAFTYFIGMNYSLYEAIRLASITGAISVTRIGSRYSIPNLKEVLDYDNVI